MRTINIFLASSSELTEERLAFAAFVTHLNTLFAGRQIVIGLKCWESLDSSMGAEHKQAEYNRVVRDCEMLLALFGRQLGDYTREELDTARAELLAGRKPQKIYVFFKDAAPDELSAEMRQFKDDYAANYQHFYTRFDNIDTLKYQFLLQLEIYFNSMEPLLELKDGFITVNGQRVAELKNIPAMASNADYQRLTQEVEDLTGDIDDLTARSQARPDDQRLFARLLKKRMERETLQKELAKLEQSIFDTGKKVAELAGQTCNQITREAMQLLEQGDVKAAVAMLDPAALRRDAVTNMAQLRRTEEEANVWRQNVEADINAFLLRAKALQSDLSIPSSERCRLIKEAYDQALNIARKFHWEPQKLADNILFHYAYWCQKWNQFADALSFYSEALEIYRSLAISAPAKYLPKVAIVLNNLGTLQRYLGHYEDAQTSYGESLKIRRDLAASAPDVYLPDVAMILNNLGNLQGDVGRYEEAQISHEESLKIRRGLAASSPEAYLPYVARTLNNLGVLQRSLGHSEDAQTSYEESLKICRDLAASAPDVYMPDLAMTLNNLGNLQSDRGCYEDAQASYEESLQIRRDLATSAPDVHLPDVAMTLNNLGVLQNDLGQHKEAQMSYGESLKIYRDLAASAPDVYMPYVAMTLNNLGNLQSDCRRYENAQISYEESLKIYRDLAASAPDVHLPDVAMTLNNLGVLQKELGHDKEAQVFYEEALGIYCQLIETASEVYVPDFCGTAVSFGEMLVDNNMDAVRGQALIDEAVALAKKYPGHLKCQDILREFEASQKD